MPHQASYGVVATNGFDGVPVPENVCPVPAIATEITGLSATGVTLLLAAVYAPVPIAFTAATRNTYVVPLVSPVTVALVAVDVPSANVFHVEPPLLENCTT